MMIIKHCRTYLANRTIGTISIDGHYFGETIEDVGRPYGVKIPGVTCIPEGDYRVAITHSKRFGKPMILLYTNPTNYRCQHGGIEFSGIRVHSGTKPEQSEGCVLVSGKLAELFELIKAELDDGHSVRWLIGRLQ